MLLFLCLFVLIRVRLCVYVFTHAPVHTAWLFYDTVPRSACPGLPGAGMS